MRPLFTLLRSPAIAAGIALVLSAGQSAPARAQDTVAVVIPPSACISTAHTCVTVPVVFARTDVTGVRGYSVSFHLGGGLSLCGAGITVGTYLSGFNPNTQLFVTDLGGGAYTVDETILGSPCGVVGSGTLFNIALASSVAAGTGTVTLDDVQVRNCDNDSVPASIGSAATIVIDNTPPTPISNLSASQVKSGNDGDGTTKIQLSFTNPSAGTTLSVYRAGFGNYPAYDNGGSPGSVPATPTTDPPGAPWVLTSISASGQTDEVAGRDFYYYVAITRDACDNPAISNRTSGTLNYELGDFSNGITPGQGDNLVGTADLSLLGAHYGLTGAVNVAPFEYLDVGPTTNHSVNGRPTTDDKINFEDLMMLSINFESVSKPSLARSGATPAQRDELSLSVDQDAAVGGILTTSLRVAGTGSIQGLSARLTWNPAVASPVSVSSGELLEREGGLALSAEPGLVDAALSGVSRSGLSGTGSLATVAFRRIAPGGPGLGIASVDARDSRNQPVPISFSHPAVLPAATTLLAAYPNPSRNGARLGYALARAGAVDFSIYGVDGRRLRTLDSGAREAGAFEFNWDGRDSRGHALPAGTYFARLRTDRGTFSRTLTRLP